MSGLSQFITNPVRTAVSNMINSNLFNKNTSNAGPYREYRSTETVNTNQNTLFGHYDIKDSDEKLNESAGQPLSSTTVLPLVYSPSQPGNITLTEHLSQTSPTFCADSWALAAIHALNDRIKLKRKGIFPDYITSPQVIISCDEFSLGCKGGNSHFAYRYIMQNYTTSILSSPLRNYGSTNGMNCSPSIIAKDCTGYAKMCTIPNAFKYFTIAAHGMVRGEEQMKREIFSRGPIACGMSVGVQFFSYQGGVMEDDNINRNLARNVAVEVIGWGVANNIPYWDIRCSLGTYWGEAGFGKVRRGKDDFGLETSRCAWAEPADTWSASKWHDTTVKERNDKDNRLMNFNVTGLWNPCRIRLDFNMPLFFDKAVSTSFPTTFDWRNKDGKNYIFYHKNMNLPYYCGSCWAVAVVGMLSDRWNIKIGSKAPIVLSAQAVINCSGVKQGCKGGDPVEALKMAKTMGLPEETCQEYVAIDKMTCVPENFCHVCIFPGRMHLMGDRKCLPVSN